jgi:hypothetical protein
VIFQPLQGFGFSVAVPFRVWRRNHKPLFDVQPRFSVDLPDVKMPGMASESSLGNNGEKHPLPKLKQDVACEFDEFDEFCAVSCQRPTAFLRQQQQQRITQPTSSA